MYVLRDLYRGTDNNLKWNNNDPNWTTDLINEIPFEINALN